jgi:hypothetical protein
MNKLSLSTSLSESLTENATSCIGGLIEIGLDSIMDDGILKDIPFLSTTVSIYRIGRNLSERHYIKKLAHFFNALNNGIADDEARQKYIAKINSNEKNRNAELEYLLILIDRYINQDKPQMLAKLYLSYLVDNIIWDELTMYAEIIDRLLLLDYRMLISTEGKVTVYRNIGGEAVLRLVALGLMAETNESSLFEHSHGGVGITANSLQRFTSNSKTYRLTAFGNKLVNIIK